MGGTDAGRLSISNTLGTATGAETHTLSSAEMPSHTHTQNAHSHTVTDPRSNIGEPDWVRFGTSGPLYDIDANSRSLSASSETATNQNTGGGGSHNNMQPTIVLNYIIKF
jgi:microcystin-dependent protein